MTAEKFLTLVNSRTLMPSEVALVYERLQLLEALEEGGVDNWTWYHESTKHLYPEDF